MNKIFISLSLAGFVLSVFIFHAIFMNEVQVTDEKFSNGSPKRISVYEEFLDSKNKIRELEFWENGKLRYDKQFKYNVPDGNQIFYPKIGGKVTQYIKNGQRQGMYTEKDSTGKIIKQEHWENGQMIKEFLPIQSK